MPVAVLPAEGDIPGRATTCDASGMAEIHRLFRSGFGEAPGLVTSVANGDAAHAQLVSDQLELLATTLRGHHDGEDERLWRMLADRAPACSAHVERMKAQHEKMLVHVEELEAALPAWRDSGAVGESAPVLSALGGINTALAEHFPDEEKNIVPVMERTLTPREVGWFGKHGRKTTPKGKAWYVLGGILRGQPDSGEHWLRKNMPPPGRLAWRLLGKPKYERYRAALEGR